MNRRRAGLAGVALAALLGAGGARAMASSYECNDGSTLAVNFTPKLAQVTHGGQQRTLQRLRAAGAAQYAGQGASLVTQRSSVVLQVGGREWRCNLQRGGAVDGFK